jgi:hypothetical protein
VLLGHLLEERGEALAVSIEVIEIVQRDLAF